MAKRLTEKRIESSAIRIVNVESSQMNVGPFKEGDDTINFSEKCDAV